MSGGGRDGDRAACTAATENHVGVRHQSDVRGCAGDRERGGGGGIISHREGKRTRRGTGGQDLVFDAADGRGKEARRAFGVRIGRCPGAPFEERALLDQGEGQSRFGVHVVCAGSIRFRVGGISVTIVADDKDRLIAPHELVARQVPDDLKCAAGLDVLVDWRGGESISLARRSRTFRPRNLEMDVFVAGARVCPQTLQEGMEIEPILHPSRRACLDQHAVDDGLLRQAQPLLVVVSQVEAQGDVRFSVVVEPVTHCLHILERELVDRSVTLFVIEHDDVDLAASVLDSRELILHP